MSQAEIDEAIAAVRTGNARSTRSDMLVVSGECMPDAFVRNVTIDEMHEILRENRLPGVPTIYVGFPLTGHRKAKAFVIGLSPKTRTAGFIDLMLSS